jgi:hypothetical protein
MEKVLFQGQMRLPCLRTVYVLTLSIKLYRVTQLIRSDARYSYVRCPA